ncbi:MAG TPA: serine hydrolase domain-containing protein, partial [Caulobacteraceae bacterium]
MSAETRIREALTNGLAEAGVPGLVAAARLPGGEAVEVAVGVRGVDNPAPMTTDTLFWMASCTKALTSAAALQLVEEGLIGLDDPVGRWLPQLAAPKVLKGFDAAEKPILEPATQRITLRRLLTHTSGFGYPFCSAPLARYQAAIGEASPRDEPADAVVVFEPGQGWQYGIGIDWTDRLIEAVTGEPFDAYMRRRVLGPLGMDDSGFFLSDDQRGRLASMHARTPDGSLAPMPFGMPPTRYFGMGGGGLYSSPSQYLRFLDSMLGRGPQLLRSTHLEALCAAETEGDAVGVLESSQPQTSNTFDPFPGAPKAWTLGFVANMAPGPNGRAAGSLAWAGLSNCYYWIDRASGAAGVMCAQFLPFADPRALAAFGAFERAVYA